MNSPMLTPGALQQAATFDPTGGFQAGQSLMPTFSVPNITTGAPLPAAPSGAPAGGALGSLPGSLNFARPQPQPQAPSDDAVRAFIAQNASNPAAINSAMKQYGLSIADVQRIGGASNEDMMRYLGEHPGVYDGADAYLNSIRPPTPAAQPVPGTMGSAGAGTLPSGAMASAGPPPAMTLPPVRSPTDSWRLREASPEFWTNNQNILQQTTPEALSAMMGRFGGPTTPEAQGALAAWSGQAQNGSMGTAYDRAVDQQRQNKALYDSLLTRIMYDPASVPEGYTPEEYADLQFRMKQGFNTGNVNNLGVTATPQKPMFDEYGVADWQRGEQG